MEIKAGMTFSPEMIKNLQAFPAHVPEAMPGRLIYGGSEDFSFHDIQVNGFRRAVKAILDM